LADEALAVLERAIPAATPRGTTPTAASRAAALASAQIWLTEIPTGALPAERILRSALDADPQAPDDWKAAAWRWLVPALVLQSKGAQADELLESLPTTADRLAVLETLEAVRRRHDDNDLVRKLAETELRVQAKLLEGQQELDGETRRSLQRRHALSLADAGRRKESLTALDSLAQELPRDGQTQEDLASVLMEGDETDSRAAAAKWVEVASKSRPGTPRWFRAHFGLARTQLKLGQHSQAAATIQAVAAKYPELGGAAMKRRFEDLLAQAKKPG
jgi:hypothetical protein